MLDALPALLGLLAFGLPFPLCVAAYVVASRWRVRGAAPGAPSRLFARPLGLLALAVCAGTGVVGTIVVLATLRSDGGSAVLVVFMALACAGASLGAAGLGQRRARWAGALAILLGLMEWLGGGILLFLVNVGVGMPGRPLRLRGVPVLPRVRRGRRRPDGAPGKARVAGLTARERRALARAWRDDARYEAASVPAFERLARDLEVAGAPGDLVASTRHAADEEVGHAHLCFGLASSYAGYPLGAAPLLFAPSRARRAETRSALLERLAIESLVDGCVGEGAAALGAALGAERAVDPIVRDVLERVAREESTHAELAWAILDWLLGEDPRLASVLHDRLERLATGRSGASEPAAGDLAPHGRVSPSERRAHLLRAREQARQRLASSRSPRPWSGHQT